MLILLLFYNLGLLFLFIGLEEEHKGYLILGVLFLVLAIREKATALLFEAAAGRNEACAKSDIGPIEEKLRSKACTRAPSRRDRRSPHPERTDRYWGSCRGRSRRSRDGPRAACRR